MNGPDLQKLRRFALAFGLILITYAVAGVELDTPARITPLGIPLVLKNPNLMGWGLALASIYGAARYWYYAIILTLSPRRARKLMLKGILVGKQSSLVNDIETAYKLVKRDIDHYFPKLPYSKDLDYKLSRSGDQITLELGEPIPVAVRLLTLLQDSDYYAPVWLNIVAVVAFVILK